MKYVNLTPHDVTIVPESGEPVTVPPSGIVARVTETTEEVDGCTVVELGDVVGLPEPVDGTVYIASTPLLMVLALKGVQRPDVKRPHGQVRDGAGRTIGCRALATLRVA